MIKPLLITVLTILLTACGAKGDLYLPGEKAKDKSDKAVTAPQSKKKTDNQELLKNHPQAQEKSGQPTL